MPRGESTGTENRTVTGLATTFCGLAALFCGLPLDQLQAVIQASMISVGVCLK